MSNEHDAPAQPQTTSSNGKGVKDSMSNEHNIPIQLKAKLLELSKQLPKAARSEFLRSASARLSELALNHTNTIAFAIAGWAVGEILDNLLCIPVPWSDQVIELTADHASDWFGLVGGFYGLFQDQQNKALRVQINSILKEELRRAMGNSEG